MSFNSWVTTQLKHDGVLTPELFFNSNYTAYSEGMALPKAVANHFINYINFFLMDSILLSSYGSPRRNEAIH